MTFQDSVKTCFSKYVTFSGRAVRSEFWWFVLFIFAGNFILGIVDSVLFGTTVITDTGFEASTNTPVLSGLFGLATLLPGISVAVRRLHDIDRSGWWYWIILIPLVGFILLIVWFATGGTRGPNRYGADPMDASGAGMAATDAGLAASDIPSVPRD